MRPTGTLFCIVVLWLGAVEGASAQGLQRMQLRSLIGACSQDAARLCSNVPRGGGRILACLNEQADRLSQECFQALAERGLAFAAALRLCRADFERLCPGVPPGYGRAVSCLVDNSAQVSPGCRQALNAHGFSGDRHDFDQGGPR